MIELALPWPPTANTYWRHDRGRTHISHAGKAYRANVLAVLWSTLGKIEPLEGPLAVSLRLTPPDRRRRDVDNVQKPLLDALEHAGVYGNDNQVSELHAFRGDPRPPGAILVQVWPLSRPDPEDEAEGRHPLVDLTDSLRMMVEADAILGGHAHTDHLRTADESMRSLARAIVDAAGQIRQDLVAGRYSPLADPT